MVTSLFKVSTWSCWELAQADKLVVIMAKSPGTLSLSREEPLTLLFVKVHQPNYRLADKQKI